jgi:hypothetical protein
MALQVEKIKSETEDERSEKATYRVIPYPADFTLQGLHDKWREGNIVIPVFQRQFVWTVIQASRLVESFLLGLPVPGIFLYKEPETGKLVVIDGQQRLRSVFSFFEGEMQGSQVPFRLREVQGSWEGKLYSELRTVDQQRLRDSVLRATIVEQIDPKDNSSIFHIFERLNTGGTSLKPQEVRNCIYIGPFNDLLHHLNGYPQWRKIIGSADVDRRMRDIELILRFLALDQRSDNYEKPMKNFLSDFMKAHRTGPKKKLDEFEEIFRKTVDEILQSLGPRPFRVHIGLNAAVLDSVMVSFAWNKKAIPDDIKERYHRLLHDQAYLITILSATTDEDVVKRRIHLARKSLFGHQ